MTTAPRGLPGGVMMWVLIFSELAVFGAGLVAFMGVRLTDPTGFEQARSHLLVQLAGVNTIILVTSGLPPIKPITWFVPSKQAGAVLSGKPSVKMVRR